MADDDKTPEPVTDPPSPPSNEPPNNPAPDPEPTPNGDGKLAEAVAGLQTTVAGLVETVSKLVPDNNIRDNAPTSVPWTHRFGRRSQ